MTHVNPSRTLLIAVVAGTLSCKTDQVLVAPAVTFPAKAVDAAPTVWGSLNGVSISGGYGSALMVDPRDPNSFYLMTDRGPNVATAVANQLFFQIPTFNPNIAKYTLSGDSLRRVGVVNLKNAAGVNLTGIPNPAGIGGTNETAIGPGSAAIPFDPDGIDPEGLAIAPDGSFWVSDEYGPHIIHFDATGRTLERMNPFGTGTGGRRIPAVLAKRRPNRGMEGLALTIDGKTLVGALQSPLDNPTTAIGRASNAHRFLTVDIATGATKQFVYVADAVGNLISEVTAISSTEFLVIERDGLFAGGTPPAVSKRVYKISLRRDRRERRWRRCRRQALRRKSAGGVDIGGAERRRNHASHKDPRPRPADAGGRVFARQARGCDSGRERHARRLQRRRFRGD